MATGTRFSYTDSSNKIRGISDAVFMIDWTEAALLNVFGFDKGNARKLEATGWPGTKIEWIEDTMPAFTSALNGAINSSVTAIVVTTGQGQYFRQGDIILIESEKMLVLSVATDTLTVATRPYGSTTAASHSSLVAVAIVGRTMPEGSDYTTGYTTTFATPFNYTQILSESVKVTKTEQAVMQYGVTDAMDYQVAKLFNNKGQAGRLAQMLQKTFYFGERVQRSSSAYGSMGGFKTFVTTNVTNLASASLQRSDIHNMIRNIRDAGGMVSHLITGSWGIEKITAMYEGSITTTRDESIGGAEIQTILTPHGKVKLVYDWMCPAGELYLTNPEKVGWLPLREFNQGEIAVQGDYSVTDVVGEYTFFLATEKSHGYIYGFSTTS